MNNRHLSLRYIFIAIATAIVVATTFDGKARDARSQRLDTAADRAKARALTQTAVTAKPLTQYAASRRAVELNPNDTAALLLHNHSKLMSSMHDTTILEQQIKLAGEYSATPDYYYMPVYTRLSRYYPEEYDRTYALLHYLTLRYPDVDLLAEKAVVDGTKYVMSLGTSKDDDYPTLDDSAKVVAQRFLQFADSVLDRRGYESDAVLYRAVVLKCLGDSAEIARSAEKVLSLDPDEPELLNNAMYLYSLAGDSAKMNDVGFKLLQAAPESNAVTNLYNQFDSLDQLIRVRDIALKYAADPSNDNLDRIRMFCSLVNVHYSKEYANKNAIDTLLSQKADSVARAIIAENPDDIVNIYLLSGIFGSNHGWTHDYGSQYIMDYTVAHPDSTDNNISILSLLSYDVPARDDFIRVMDKISSNSDEVQKTNINRLLGINAFYDKKWQRTIDLIAPLTIPRLRALIQDQYEKRRNDPEENIDEMTDNDIDTAAQEQWIKMQSLVYESLSMLDRDKEAIATLRNVLTVDSTNVETCNNLAYVLATEGGDLTEALTLVNRALANGEEDNPTYLDTRAWVYFLLGQYDKAYEDYKRIDLPYDEIIDGTLAENEAGTVMSMAPKFTDEYDSSIDVYLGHLLRILNALNTDGKYDNACLRLALTLHDMSPDNPDYLIYTDELLQTTDDETVPTEQ